MVVLKAVALVLQGKFRSFQRARPARINCLSSLIGRSVTRRCFLPFGCFSQYSRKFTSRVRIVQRNPVPEPYVVLIRELSMFHGRRAVDPLEQKLVVSGLRSQYEA